MLNPYLEVILASIIWSFTGVFVKYLHLPPTTITFFRVGIPTIFLLIFLLATKTKLFKGNNRLILFASSLNAVRLFLYFVGFAFTTITTSVIILYTWPIFAVIFSAAFLKEKITPKTVGLLSIAFLGVILMYLQKSWSWADKDIVGMSAMLLSAAIYALTVIIFKKESEKYSKFETIFYQNVVGAVIFLPFVFLNRPFPTSTQIGVGTMYALLMGLLGFALFFSALKRIKASTASFLSYAEVLSGVTLGLVFFHEALTWNMLVGGLLIVIATLLIRKDLN